MRKKLVTSTSPLSSVVVKYLRHLKGFSRGVNVEELRLWQINTDNTLNVEFYADLKVAVITIYFFPF